MLLAKQVEYTGLSKIEALKRSYKPVLARMRMERHYHQFDNENNPTDTKNSSVVVKTPSGNVAGTHNLLQSRKVNEFRYGDFEIRISK